MIFSCSALSGREEKNTVSFNDVVSACSGGKKIKTELNFIISFKEGIKLGYSVKNATQNAIRLLLSEFPSQDRKYILEKYYKCLDFTAIANRVNKIKIWNYYEFNGSCREARRYNNNNVLNFNEKIKKIFATGDIQEYAKLLKCKIKGKSIRTSHISIFYDCAFSKTKDFLSFTNDTILCDTIDY